MSDPRSNLPPVTEDQEEAALAQDEQPEQAHEDQTNGEKRTLTRSSPPRDPQ